MTAASRLRREVTVPTVILAELYCGAGRNQMIDSLFAVPLTTTLRVFPSHVTIDPDALNGLAAPSCALVEQMRAVSVERCSAASGNVGPVAAHQILDVLAMITGIP